MNYQSEMNTQEATLRTSDRPRIGITMRLELSTNRFYLGRDYSEAVEAAGGVPVLISLIPNRDYISAILDQLDGILLPGSDSDVDPVRYGAEPHPKLGSVVTIKDETDLLVLEEVEKEKPADLCDLLRHADTKCFPRRHADPGSRITASTGN